MFDAGKLTYPSMRYPLFSNRGMVCTTSAQASAAGIGMLRAGGNAMDAIVAAASSLTVTEPTSNGLGSDAFALIWSEKEHRLYGLNGSGPAPGLATIDAVHARHPESGSKMPRMGWTPVTVPGAVGAWCAINRRFGSKPLKEVLGPAAGYASYGYPVGAVLADNWNRAAEHYRSALKGPEFDEWFRVFAPEGRKLRAGDMVRLPDAAETLQEIGETGGESFYRGRIASLIDRESRRYGGFLRADDLEKYEPLWVEPASVDYRGYTVCEIPPNGQGMVALMALNILRNFRFTVREEPRTFHLQMEAMKLAFADGLHYITDPDSMELDYRRLLLPEYGASRAEEITGEARIYTHAVPPGSGTVYLCSADSEGNMVSYIQSNYMGFGSGIVVSGTGIALQNRGSDFSLDPADANCLAPGKRTYHTIIPGFLMKDGKALGPFGVMGGYMQPQGHVQTLMNLLDFHMNPQQALDAPRWMWDKGLEFLAEPEMDSAILEDLRSRGHVIKVTNERGNFGRGQMMIRLENGTICAGTEPRADSSIAVL